MVASPGYANQSKYRTAFRIGGLLLQAGFGGAAARYAAGELAPLVKDSLAYATDPEKTGPFCSKCRVRNDTGARFCDACGTALA